MMLKKKEEELRRAVAAAPQAEGALQEALSQVCRSNPTTVMLTTITLSNTLVKLWSYL